MSNPVPFIWVGGGGVAKSPAYSKIKPSVSKCWENPVYLSFRSLSDCVWVTTASILPGLLMRGYLTIIPRAQMGYESIAHEAEGQMGY